MASDIFRRLYMIFLVVIWFRDILKAILLENIHMLTKGQLQKHCRYGLFTWNKHLFCQRETDSFSLKVTLLKFWNMQISIHAREKLIYIRPLVKNMNSTNNILECHRKKIKVMQSEGTLSHLLQDEYVYLRSLCFIIYNGFGNYW